MIVGPVFTGWVADGRLYTPMQIPWNGGILFFSHITQ